MYRKRERERERERESLCPCTERERESLSVYIERAGWLAGWLTGWQAGAHFCHWSLLILRFSKIGIKILNITKDV